MKILVTGGSGFIGTNYLEYLIQNGTNEFINVDFKEPRNVDHKKFWSNCDILDKPKLKKIIKEFSPTHIVHLAAKTGLSNKISDYKTNTEGVENLLDILEDISSIRHVIFTSSLLVCEPGYYPKSDIDYRPFTVYGKSKMMMEEIIRSRKDLHYTWTITRPISIWGPWIVEPFTNFFKLIAKGFYFHIGSGNCLRSFGYVENTAYQIHELLLNSMAAFSNETLYLADNPPVDLYDFASEVSRVINGKRINHMPLIIVKLIAQIGDIFKFLGWKNVPLTTFRLKNMQTEIVYTNLLSPIEKIAWPLPYDYKDGVERTVKWLRKEKII